MCNLLAVVKRSVLFFFVYSFVSLYCLLRGSSVFPLLSRRSVVVSWDMSVFKNKTSLSRHQGLAWEQPELKTLVWNNKTRFCSACDIPPGFGTRTWVPWTKTGWLSMERTPAASPAAANFQRAFVLSIARAKCWKAKGMCSLSSRTEAFSFPLA